jgi:hypothetical protein
MKDISTPKTPNEIERLKRQEQSLRELIKGFSASDCLSRDELYQRDVDVIKT